MSEVEPLQALNMDAKQQQAFVRYYRNLPQKTSTTIRFFNHNDYYTIHGEDATLAKQEFNANVIKYMGLEPKLSYVVLNKAKCERCIRELLLIKNYKVGVYVKLEQGKNNDWNLEYKGSPGNLSQFEDILFENNDVVINSVVMGLKLIKKTVAVCFVNTTENTCTLGEFTDNEYFTELESIIAQISPKECIIPISYSGELKTLEKTLTRNGVLVVKQKSSEFDTKNVIQDLNRLLYFKDKQIRNAAALHEINYANALGALQVVINYLNLIGDEQNFNQYKLQSLETKQYVRLNIAALHALNIIGKPGLNYNKNDTVFGVLDSCKTTQGKRLLEQWLKQPLRDVNLIKERQEVVETLFIDSEMRYTLITNCLPHIPELLLLSKKLCSRKATLQDCYRIYQAIDSVPRIVAALKASNNVSVKVELITPLCDVLTNLEKYQLMIEHTLDMDLVDKGEYLIKPSFNEELNELHVKRKAVQKKIQKLFADSASALGFESGKTVKLEYTDQNVYSFKVTLKEEKYLRQTNKYQIIDVNKGGVRFTNDELSKLNERYSQIKEAYEDSQRNLVQELLDVASGYANALRELNFYVGKVDVYVSLANAAATSPIPYVRPKILEEGTGKITIKQARHVCLERQDSTTFIPNDVEFDKSDKLLYIITGPNMGGKSTYMRSIGICVLLAQIGSFIPCEYAEISATDCILARIGAEDADMKGLSTFMMEMVETCSIVRSITSNSLVIIDELGRGTSTYDGCGIAYAIAKYLAKEVKCFALFATHFHEITHLPETISEVLNCHVTALVTDENVTPLYQIREGPCDKSYGIHCAKLVEFNEELIECAIEHQKRLEEHEGMKFIKDYEASLKRKIVDEGDAIIESVVKKCKGIEIENISDKLVLSTVKKIKSDLESSPNLFIKGLLSSL